jgi:hypothetical protein
LNVSDNQDKHTLTLLKYDIQGLWLSRDLLILERIRIRPKSDPTMCNSSHKFSPLLNASRTVHAFALHYAQSRRNVNIDLVSYTLNSSTFSFSLALLRRVSTFIRNESVHPLRIAFDVAFHTTVAFFREESVHLRPNSMNFPSLSPEKSRSIPEIIAKQF